MLSKAGVQKQIENDNMLFVVINDLTLGLWSFLPNLVVITVMNCALWLDSIETFGSMYSVLGLGDVY